MDKLLIIGAWFSVRRALAAKLGCAADKITLIDFWRSAAGLRVAFKWADSVCLCGRFLAERRNHNEEE